jgi:hypothetical protein
LVASFGQQVYQGAPNIFQMVTALHTENPSAASAPHPAETDEAVVIETSLSVDLRVTALSPGAIRKIGAIVGRTLISADWVSSAILTLAEYSPYSCVLDSRTSSGYQSKILCQIYPFSPERISQGAAAIAGTALVQRGSTAPTVPSPTKLLWIMTEWTADDIAQIFKVLQCQFCRLLDFASQTLAQFTARTGRVCPKFSSRIEHIEALALAEIPPNVAITIRHIVEYMKQFLGWVELLESETWSDEALLAKFGGGSLYSSAAPKTSPPKKPSPSPEAEGKRKGSSSSGGSGSLAHEYSDEEEDQPNGVASSLSACESWSEYQQTDISLFLLLAAEIDQIFVTTRDSSCCPNIIALLQQTADRDQTQIIETYISYCLTKHTHPRIRYLMKLSQDLIRSQLLENAVNVLTEVPSLPPSILSHSFPLA